MYYDIPMRMYDPRWVEKIVGWVDIWGVMWEGMLGGMWGGILGGEVNVEVPM